MKCDSTCPFFLDLMGPRVHSEEGQPLCRICRLEPNAALAKDCVIPDVRKAKMKELLEG